MEVNPFLFCEILVLFCPKHKSVKLLFHSEQQLFYLYFDTVMKHENTSDIKTQNAGVKDEFDLAGFRRGLTQPGGSCARETPETYPCLSPRGLQAGTEQNSHCMSLSSMCLLPQLGSISSHYHTSAT